MLITSTPAGFADALAGTEDERFRVINGHNIPVCRALAALGERFDVIIGSPPYNNGGSPSAREHPHSSRGSVAKDYDVYLDALPEDIYQQQQIEQLTALADLITPDGSMFYVVSPRIWDRQEIDPADWIKHTPWRIYQRIVWAQHRTHSHNTGYCSITHEWIFWLTRMHAYPVIDHDIANRGSVWDVIVPTKQPKRFADHPCPFPPAIPERAILLACPEGGKVLDPWAGVGTTGWAALRNEKRPKYTGIDLSAAYCGISHRDIQVYQQPLIYVPATLPGCE